MFIGHGGSAGRQIGVPARLLGLVLGLCGVLVVLEVWHGLSAAGLVGDLEM